MRADEYIDAHEPSRVVQLLQPHHLPTAEVFVSELHVRPSGPQGQRLIEPSQRSFGRACPSVCDEPIETPCIDLNSRRHQPIARRHNDDRVGSDECTEPRYVGLQRVHVRWRPLTVPGDPDQSVARHDLAMRHQERRKNAALPDRAERPAIDGKRPKHLTRGHQPETVLRRCTPSVRRPYEATVIVRVSARLTRRPTDRLRCRARGEP